MVHLPSAVIAGACALVLAVTHARAEPSGAAARRACTGVYSGAGRGIFKCKVSAVHRPGTGTSAITLDLAEDIQLTGDALQATLGGLEWNGELAVGTRSLRGEGAAAHGGSYLQTGLPPTPSDYVAAKGWPKYAVDQGNVSFTITSVTPGAAAADGSRSFEVHGTFAATLLPYPAGSHAVGNVRITASF